LSWVGVDGDLVIVLAQGCDHTILVPGIAIEDEGGESSVAVGRVVKNGRNRGLKSVIASIPVQAGIVSKSLGVPSATDLVVSLIEISGADHEIAFPVAFKTGAGRDVEDSVGAVAIVGVVAASLNFEVVDILGIDLRAHIVGNVGVGDGDTVDQPLDLVASSHVQHIVRYIGGGHVVCDHLHAVGAVRSGSFLDVLAVQHGRRGDTVCGRFYWSSRDRDGFLHG